MSGYIIESRLDSDFYKFTMGQFVFHRYPDVQVKYSYKNRSSAILLGNEIPEPELREELDNFMNLPWGPGEIEYLGGIKVNGKCIFAPDYLDFLASLKKLPGYLLEKQNGQYILEFLGRWSEAIYWETPALAIKNELFYRNLLKNCSPLEKDEIYKEGFKRLWRKISRLKKYPGAQIIEFGTRRRFERLWQDYVVKTFKTRFSPKQFIGTSNIYLARKYGIDPKGTMAHELFMAIAAMMSDTNEGLLRSQNRVFDEWEEEYGPNLLVALTDTFGTDFTLRTITKERAQRWSAFRPDSGDALEIGRNILNFLSTNGIDTKSKGLVPSDGLEDGTIISLRKAFRKETKTAFGWGTNATNDLGPKAVSQVIKLVEVDGRRTVKLSDNLAKATGSPEDIERYKKVFGYTGTTFEECVY